jgi:biopolymer transport protein ExbB
MKRLAANAAPVLMAAALLIFAYPAVGQDLREAYRKAAEDRAAVEARAADKEEVILANRVRLQSAVIELEARQAELERRLADVEAHIEAQTLREKDLVEEWEAHELDFKEISGNVRLAARDLETMLHQSHFTGFLPDRVDRISPLLDKGYFPDIDDIAGMAEVIFEEIRLAGEVGIHEAEFIGRDGSEVIGQVLTLGKFTAAYEMAGESGFLNWSPEGARFYALTELPKGNVGRHLRGYLAGERGEVPLDLSGGNALRQITHQTGFIEQVRAGGPIVWPIIGLAVVALLIVLARIVFLNRIHANTDRFMGEVNEYAARGDWAAAEDLVTRHGKRRSPVIAVIKAGLSVRKQDRETQESVLQEAILHEMPRVESGLSVLAVLGAVAPLLGLLGTVTGMINTFRVITLFGTGDPKLMSGGISEALVTTELGLMVAIPIMLAHTFLSRRADHIIGDMEEKAVQMTNIIQIRNQEQAMVAAAGEC